MKPVFFILLLFLFISGCIGDDILFDTVEENLRITASVDTLAVGGNYTFSARFTNNIGAVEERTINWYSSNPAVLTTDPMGLATGIMKGAAYVIAEVELNNSTLVRDSARVVVDEETSSENNSGTRSGQIKTTSSYLLQGNFSLHEEAGKLILEFEDNYRASDRLPGLYVYLTNNANSSSNAFEIGKVVVFEGTHRYEINGVGLKDYDYVLYYCKPFSVKVGDGKLSN